MKSLLFSFALFASYDISLDEFVCTITGHWDNVEQSEADKAAGRSALMDYHPRRAMTYVPIENPNVEGQLFAILNYGEEGFGGDLLRMSLHRFRQHGGQVVHEFMFPKDKTAFGDPVKTPEILGTFREDEVRINTTCAMYWHAADNHYTGETKKDSCVTSSFTPKPIKVEGEGHLYPDLLTRHDMNFDLESGKRLPTPGGNSAELFKRVEREDAATDPLVQRLQPVRRVLKGCK